MTVVVDNDDDDDDDDEEEEGYTIGYSIFTPSL